MGRITFGIGPREIRIINVTLSEPPLARGIGLGLGALVATAVLGYWSSWVPLWRPHGLFVAFLALILVYGKRDQIAAARIRPLPWACLILIPLCVLASRGADTDGLQFLVLPPMLLVAVAAAFGFEMARLMLLPVLFLYFSAPELGLVISPPLQALTVKVVAGIGPHIGLPLTTSGNIVSFPNGITFIVTDSCSGANFLIQGLALATLLGELERASAARRIGLWLGMVPVALLGNWLRVFMILGVGYATDMHSTLATTAHVPFGYGIFLAVLALYMWVVSLQPLPADARQEGMPRSRWRPHVSYYLVLVLMALVPLAAHLANSRTGVAMAMDKRS